MVQGTWLNVGKLPTFNHVPCTIVTSSLLTVLDYFDNKLVQEDQIFQAIPKWAWFSQAGQRKTQKSCNFV